MPRCSRVEFDPSVVSFEQLLEVFWAMHDPTQVDRQGPDVGDQYRSAIFTNSDEQQRAAEASRDAAQARFDRPIATEITPRDPSTPRRTTTSGTTTRTATSRTAT
jgi:peptide-methionine (S)-S-oxide reductase